SFLRFDHDLRLIRRKARAQVSLRRHIASLDITLTVDPSQDPLSDRLAAHIGECPLVGYCVLRRRSISRRIRGSLQAGDNRDLPSDSLDFVEVESNGVK